MLQDDSGTTNIQISSNIISEKVPLIRHQPNRGTSDTFESTWLETTSMETRSKTMSTWRLETWNFYTTCMIQGRIFAGSKINPKFWGKTFGKHQSICLWARKMLTVLRPSGLSLQEDHVGRPASVQHQISSPVGYSNTTIGGLCIFSTSSEHISPGNETCRFSMVFYPSTWRWNKSQGYPSRTRLPPLAESPLPEIQGISEGIMEWYGTTADTCKSRIWRVCECVTLIFHFFLKAKEQCNECKVHSYGRLSTQVFTFFIGRHSRIKQSTHQTQDRCEKYPRPRLWGCLCEPAQLSVSASAITQSAGGPAILHLRQSQTLKGLIYISPHSTDIGKTETNEETAKTSISCSGAKVQMVYIYIYIQ